MYVLTNVNISENGLLVQRVQGKVLVVARGSLPVPDAGGDLSELLEE